MTMWTYEVTDEQRNCTHEWEQVSRYRGNPSTGTETTYRCTKCNCRGVIDTSG